MKKLAIISTLFLTAAITISSCSSKRDPGTVYMPDMSYSRAMETYADRDSSIYTMDPSRRGGHMIYYNSQPVTGSIKRGELFPYKGSNDSTGYIASDTVKNPFASLTKSEMDEAGRLYNINCGICHGATGEANGPLAGKIGGIANLKQPVYVSMSDGKMFHSITYGKGVMGSYASQLDRDQRWMVINYLRTLQGKAAGAKTDSTATKTGGAKTDSTGMKAGGAKAGGKTAKAGK